MFANLRLAFSICIQIGILQSADWLIVIGRGLVEAARARLFSSTPPQFTGLNKGIASEPRPSRQESRTYLRVPLADCLQ